jgi:hypothetical protein
MKESQDIASQGPAGISWERRGAETIRGAMMAVDARASRRGFGDSVLVEPPKLEITRQQPRTDQQTLGL